MSAEQPNIIVFFDLGEVGQCLTLFSASAMGAALPIASAHAKRPLGAPIETRS